MLVSVLLWNNTVSSDGYVLSAFGKSNSVLHHKLRLSHETSKNVRSYFSLWNTLKVWDQTSDLLLKKMFIKCSTREKVFIINCRLMPLISYLHSFFFHIKCYSFMCQSRLKSLAETHFSYTGKPPNCNTSNCETSNCNTIPTPNCN